MSGKLKWYAARLMAMSPMEVAHRVMELVEKRRLAAITAGWSAFPTHLPVNSDFPLLRRMLSMRSPGSLNELLSRSRFLGYRATFPAAPEPTAESSLWFDDPVSGRCWPGQQISAFKVDVRSTSASPSQARPYGDVKFVWEPNRLQILQALAGLVASGHQDGPQARAYGFAVLKSWMAANPPYRGVNWTSGIELSLRLVSLTVFLAALEPMSLTPREEECVARFVLAHARMLQALPSLYSSANNHRIAEGLGLYLSGCLLQQADMQFGYMAHGREILEKETLNQIHPDGVGAEQSPTYQAFSMELVAFAGRLDQERGKGLAKASLDRLFVGAEFLSDLQSGRGVVPAIGDDDEGRALQWPHQDEPDYVPSVAASVAALCGRPLASWRPGYFRETLFGVDRMEVVSRAASALKHYDTGGYDILRCPTKSGDLHCVFDHGPLGFLSLAAHGHADALALWLSLGGAPVFIDAGTWLYHSGEAVRAELRRSFAHNTLSIVGASQSEPSSAFSWSSRANARRLEPDADLMPDATFRMAGDHDGYLARYGVRHRRDIAVSSARMVVADRLEGAAASQDVEISFLCAPGLMINNNGECSVAVCASGESLPLLRLTAPDGFSLVVETDAKVSPRFGRLTTTARILLKGRLTSQPCLTVIDFGTA